MLNSPTFKISHYFTIPDPGKGVPSFESLIQALSKSYEKGTLEGHLKVKFGAVYNLYQTRSKCAFFSIDPSLIRLSQHMFQFI